METFKVLPMNGGVGETSYAHNSSLQSKALSNTEHIKKEAIQRMYQSFFPTAAGCLCIADLGCSSGPNALYLVHQLLSAINAIPRHEVGKQSLEFQILLNDLPENDFNTTFRSLPSFYRQLVDEELRVGDSCFFNGVPGSFYGRLFPKESLHFVHSSFSLHWLSRVPEKLENCNKGELWLSRSSTERVMKAYVQQFRVDFSSFLRFRLEEMVVGGCMVFTLLGREDDAHFSKRDATYAWNLLSLAISQMVCEGLVEEEKLDSFNIPLYVPSPTEITSEVEKQGRFNINCIQVSEVGWETAAGNGEEAYLGKLGCMRVVAEPLLVAAFGNALMDDIFRRYAELLRDAMSAERCVYLNLTVSLTKIA